MLVYNYKCIYMDICTPFNRRVNNSKETNKVLRITWSSLLLKQLDYQWLSAVSHRVPWAVIGHDKLISMHWSLCILLSFPSALLTHTGKQKHSLVAFSSTSTLRVSHRSPFTHRLTVWSDEVRHLSLLTLSSSPTGLTWPWAVSNCTPVW